jgi:uncharacterized membrane protein
VEQVLTQLGAGHEVADAYGQWLTVLLPPLMFLANAAGGLVVGVAVVRGLIRYVSDLLRVGGDDLPKEAIRLSLGRSLALALEFQLGADILATALNPTLRDIATLAAIVVLRTVLNFFLGKELAGAEQRGRAGLPAEADDGAGPSSRPG